MEAVAEHINEMHKIYEEYGNVFDDMTNDYKDTHPEKKVSKFADWKLYIYKLRPVTERREIELQ